MCRHGLERARRKPAFRVGWLTPKCALDVPPLKVPHMGWNEISVRQDQAVTPLDGEMLFRARLWRGDGCGAAK